MKYNDPLSTSVRNLMVAIALGLTCAITARADYQSTVLSDTPLAFYPLNLDVDTSGTATDVSGNGNNGSYVNIFSGYNNANGPSAYITNAINFDGFDTSVDLSSASSLTGLNGKVTLEAWVQPADSSSFGDIIAKGYDSSTYQESYIRVDGPYGAVYDVNLGNAQITGGQQNTSWSHVVLANDGATTRWYINGILVQSKSDSSGAISFSDPWAIGNGTSAGNGRHFNGNMTEVAFYTNGLSAAQVLNHYFVGLVGIPASNAVPIINTQPQSQASYVGGTAVFSVVAVSGPAMTNQWYFGSNPLPGQTGATLTLSNLQLTNAGNYHVVVGNSNGTTNSTIVSLTVSTPRNLQWSANANNGGWDKTSANWINLANSQPTAFNDGDAVLFDDTAGVPTTVGVSNAVTPSLVNVNSSVNNYTFNGPNNLAGYGSFIKSGSSTLNIFTPSGFTGSVAVNGGTVYAGNNCFRSVSSIAVTNGATLDLGGGTFNNLTPITVSGTGVSGQGALINTYADYPGELINLTMSGDALVGGTARWDMASGAQINGAHNLSIDMSAAGGYAQWNGVSIGASVPQINVNNGSTLGLTSMDTGCQNPATVFNISTNGQLVLYSGGFNGSLNLYNGAQLVVYSANVNLGGATLHVYPGATMYLYAQGIAMTGSNLILENGAAVQTYYNGGNNPIANQVTLNGVAHLVLGNHSESFNNVVSGAGGFVLDYYDNQLICSASNTYSGPTIIGNGPEVALTGNGSISHSSLIFFGGNSATSPHIDASGRSDSTLTLVSGQTLGGIGAVVGNLVESAGATIAPAGTNTTIGITTGSNPTGAISASGNVTLNGTTVLKLNGSGANDSVQAAGNLTCGGTLSLANVSGAPLAAGNSFQILAAGGSISGSFAGITPATPGTGLAWNTNQLSSGLLSVVSTGAPHFTGISASGGNMILSGTGGSPGGTFHVLTSTNLTIPLTNWVVLSTNTYDPSGNFTVTNAISGSTPQRFFSIEQ